MWQPDYGEVDSRPCKVAVEAPLQLAEGSEFRELVQSKLMLLCSLMYRTKDKNSWVSGLDTKSRWSIDARTLTDDDFESCSESRELTIRLSFEVSLEASKDGQ